MKQPRLVWLVFAAAAAVVLASMAWVTAAVLRLDAAEAESRRRAQLEENVRLALWRMDSALAPLLAAEHARPDRGPAAPSATPLRGTQASFVSWRFRYPPSGAGQFFSPEGAAPDQERPAGQPAYATLLAALPPADAPPDEPVPEALANAAPVKGGKQSRSYQEYQARAANTQQQVQVQSNATRVLTGPASTRASGPLTALWMGEDLLLARRVASRDEPDVVQGCRVDWPAVESWLLQSVKDLLPEAKLVPVPPGGQPADGDTRLLASLPARLEPGPLPAAVEPRAASPLRVSLLAAWAGAVLAIAAVGLLLRGVSALSERRGAFVSAVTHELRTPLTTLRMYTEMLAEGMVDDPSQRRTYLQTLRAEADRLGHLVENVLAYSRLERNRAGYEATPVKLGEALSRAVERLADRARQAGMQFVHDVPGDLAALTVRVNSLGLEQVLFNLVDNACKYAAGAADKRIELTAKPAADGNRVELWVRDHGPGVSTARSGRLFRPFSKSVQEAANTAPGLGLGLAISRRLSEAMGGELRATSAPGAGAAFIVSLPRVEPA